MMTDSKVIIMMNILDKLGAVCFIASSPLFAVVAYRSLQLTLKHGVSESSPATFALMGSFSERLFKIMVQPVCLPTTHFE